MQFIWSVFPLFLTCMKVGENPGPYEILEKLTLRARYIHTMCLCTPPPQDYKSVQFVLMFGGGP